MLPMRSVAWLKRDLRISDHRALAKASQSECIALYIAEPSIRAAIDFAPCHEQFILQSLAHLRTEISALGGRLIYTEGEAVDTLDRLYEAWPFDQLLSHQETGNGMTFTRDKAVRSWVIERGIQWIEFPQHGVFRGQAERDGWSARWRARMQEPVTPVPSGFRSPDTRFAVERCLPEPKQPSSSPIQRGGEAVARETLESFLYQRGQNYATEMSSPVTAGRACARISPYLAWGNISMRTVLQATQERSEALREQADRPPHWLKSLAAFGKRLRWHCHFIQKLEDQPSIEFENMQRACDGLREDEFNENYFSAWKEGRTGFPMVDACMRALRERKWINFRMRAMLVSFASYDLWLDWRRTAPWLARQFLDYEPGIHYSQFQMQSGTTGINTLRIYSPAKQVLDQDPEGHFIHRWCPELSALTGNALARPETLSPTELSAAGLRPGGHYSNPIVDHAQASREARRRVSSIRKTIEAREESRQVLARHGSRKKPGRKNRRS